MDKQFVNHLVTYIAATIAGIPVCPFDTNADREHPSIVVGLESFTLHPVMKLNGSARVFALVAYDPKANAPEEMDAIADSIKTLLADADVYDTTGFTLNFLGLSGTTREDDGELAEITLFYDADLAA